MKREVYSWRLSSELKSELEREARSRKVPVSAVLHLAVQDWLKKSVLSTAGDEEQRRLQEAASSCLGILEGHNARRAESARQMIRERIHRRHGR